MANFPKTPPSIGRSTGLRGATGTAGTPGAGLPTGWVGAKQTYGAAGDGVTDDTTPLQNMLTYLKTNGGTGYVEPGTYIVSGVLNGDSNTAGYTLRGAGGGGNVNMKSKIVFTGAGAVNGITFNSTFGLDICHLWFSATVLTGNIVQCDGQTHAIDSQYSSLHDCAFDGPTPHTANAGLMLNKTNVWNVHDCVFSKCLYGLQLGSRYVNGTTIGPRNLFNNNTTAHILINSNDFEASKITGNTFEGGLCPVGIQGDPGVFIGGGAALVGAEISSNWFGDVGTATIWLNQLASWSLQKVCTIRNNYFGVLSGGTAACYLRGSWLSVGNVFDSIPAYDTDDYSKFSLMSLGDSGLSFPGASRPVTYVNLPITTTLGNAALPYSPPGATITPGTSPGTISHTTSPVLPVIVYTGVGAKTATLHPSTDGVQYTYPVGTVLQLLNPTATTVTVTTSATPPTLNAAGGTAIPAGGSGFLVQTALDVWYLTIT